MTARAMKITIKLFALLGKYLPSGAVDSAAEIEVAEAATPGDVIRGLNLPQEYCHLVLVNGHYLAPSERDRRALAAGDTIAIWPPVAGGR